MGSSHNLSCAVSLGEGGLKDAWGLQMGIGVWVFAFLLWDGLGWGRGSHVIFLGPSPPSSQVAGMSHGPTSPALQHRLRTC